MKERIDYRARKWLFQQLPQYKSSDQLRKLDEKDWDILVVLDACRTDALRKAAGWPVESVISPASCTPEWLTAVSEHGIFDGTHVISGNPQYTKVDVELGCTTIEPYWETHWSERLQTTLPEPILDTVDQTVENTTDGVVAHLQQPHWPYVARLGDNWSLAYRNLGPWKTGGKEVISMQVAMQRGLIDAHKTRRAYRASVESIWHVLNEYLGRWVDHGYTVIVTADHGETFGRFREFGFYEHPCGCHVAPLVDVPWIELHPQKDRTEMESVEDRLRALGYAE